MTVEDRGQALEIQGGGGEGKADADWKQSLISLTYICGKQAISILTSISQNKTVIFSKAKINFISSKITFGFTVVSYNSLTYKKISKALKIF